MISEFGITLESEIKSDIGNWNRETRHNRKFREVLRILSESESRRKFIVVSRFVSKSGIVSESIVKSGIGKNKEKDRGYSVEEQSESMEDRRTIK